MFIFDQADGEAQAATMLGEAISKNPGYLKLRKLKASREISRTVTRHFVALSGVTCRFVDFKSNQLPQLKKMRGVICLTFYSGRRNTRNVNLFLKCHISDFFASSIQMP